MRGVHWGQQSVTIKDCLHYQHTQKGVGVIFARQQKLNMKL